MSGDPGFAWGLVQNRNQNQNKKQSVPGNWVFDAAKNGTAVPSVFVL